MLVGALSHSGRFRGVFCEQMTFGHLADAMHGVLVALGGTPRVWRTDRMATIVIPGTDRLTVDAAQAAKHYGVEIAVCPPQRAQRKGVVEAAIKYMTESWWRSARGRARWPRRRRRLDRWCVEVADQRRRPRRDGRRARRRRAAAAAAGGRLPGADRGRAQASRSALVAFEGNHYSVPPGLAGRTVTVHARVGEPHPADRLRRRASWSRRTAAPRPAPGRRSAAAEHAAALEQAVLAAFTTGHACRAQGQPAARPGRARRARPAPRPRRAAGAGRSTSSRYAALREVAC